MGGEGEGSGVKGGGKWGERGREVGVAYPPVHPLKDMASGSNQAKISDILCCAGINIPLGTNMFSMMQFCFYFLIQMKLPNLR